jgi:hypothetical protein
VYLDWWCTGHSSNSWFPEQAMCLVSCGTVCWLIQKGAAGHVLDHVLFIWVVILCVIYGLILYWFQDQMPVGLRESSGIGKQMDYWKIQSCILLHFGFPLVWNVLYKTGLAKLISRPRKRSLFRWVNEPYWMLFGRTLRTRSITDFMTFCS